MPPVLVQGKFSQGPTDATYLPGWSVTLDAPVAAGGAIVIAVQFSQADVNDPSRSYSCVITDDKGNNYKFVDAFGSPYWTFQIFYLEGIANGPRTLTLTSTSGNHIGYNILVEEYSGIFTTGALEGHSINFQANADTGPNAVTSNTFSMPYRSDLIWGACWYYGAMGGTRPGSGFTIGAHDNVVGAFTTEHAYNRSSSFGIARFTNDNTIGIEGTTRVFITAGLSLKTTDPPPPSSGGSGRDSKEYLFYFAWVPNPSDNLVGPPGLTTSVPWDVSYARFDEDIFDLVIQHDEGQIPTAIVEIRNPRIGFISPTRLYWAWISFSFDGGTPWPLFFGRLVGIPEEITHNTVKLKLIARDPRYVYQKQKVAESLKIMPNYDPIFFEVSKRDDPDAILEGWSALYHVDRVSNKVTASDILIGEDGTVVFAQKDMFYDSVQCKILQSPLVAVNVKAEVHWAQQYRGTFDIGTWAYPTLGHDAFIGEWPKSGSNLGGGYTAGVSWAGERDPDPLTAGLAQMKPTVPSYTMSYQNKEKQHGNGDVMSITMSYTPPWGNMAFELRRKIQIGLVDPYSVNNGAPAPTNIPASVTIDWFCCKTYALDFLGKQSVATIGLNYNADRKRLERLEMTVKADVQPVLIDPLLIEDTEQIALKSGDLSLPLILLENWDSVGYGGHVNLGDIVYPDNPVVPGQTSSQICIQEGNTGQTIPTFSNIAGETTQDGTVLWASMGATPPTEAAQDWVRDAFIGLGTLIVPKPVSGVPNWDSVLKPAHLTFPPTAVPIPKYSIYCMNAGGPGDTMLQCLVAGMIGGEAPQAQMGSFINPSAAYMYVCVGAGETSDIHITFSEGKGAYTGDGSVLWRCIGLIHLPVGGWPGMTPAAAYFPQDRGRQSVQHMIARARAKLRKRARAVEVRFDTRFEAAAQLSCRMNGLVADSRLPGGNAAGKVTSYKLEAHGTGQIKGSVVLGCSIGTGSHGPETDLGTPGYVQSGYVEDGGYAEIGYQQFFDEATGDAPVQGLSYEIPLIIGPQPPINEPPVTLPPAGSPPLDSPWTPAAPVDLAGNEVGYTPPVFQPCDDGIGFPASPSELIMQSQWHGIASTLNPGNIELYNLQIQTVIHDAIAGAQVFGGEVNTPDSSVSATMTIPANPIYDIQAAAQAAIITKAMSGTGLWYELVLRPVNTGPFAGAYIVKVSNLSLPMTINLSATSSGGLLQ